jgi:hypothetical protein
MKVVSDGRSTRVSPNKQLSLLVTPLETFKFFWLNFFGCRRASAVEPVLKTSSGLCNGTGSNSEFCTYFFLRCNARTFVLVSNIMPILIISKSHLNK